MAGPVGASHGGVEGLNSLYYQDETQRRLSTTCRTLSNSADLRSVRSPGMTVYVASPDGSLEKSGLAGLRSAVP